MQRHSRRYLRFIQSLVTLSREKYMMRLAISMETLNQEILMTGTIILEIFSQKFLLKTLRDLEALIKALMKRRLIF